MRASLLAELSNLFSREALLKDKRGARIEAERLWDISTKLYKRFQKAALAEARRPIR